MKGSAMVYGRHTWETLAQMNDDIYNKIQLKEMIKDPEYIYINDISISIDDIRNERI